MMKEKKQNEFFTISSIVKTSDFNLTDFADNHQAQNYYNRHGSDTVEHAFALANILHMHKLVSEAAYFYGLAFNLHSRRPDEYPLASSLLQARLLCLLKAGQPLPADELEHLHTLSESIWDYITGIELAWRGHDTKAALKRMGACFESFHTGEEADVLYLETALSVMKSPVPTKAVGEEQKIPSGIYLYWDKDRPEEVENNYEYHQSELDMPVHMFNRDEGAEWLYSHYGLEARDLFLSVAHFAESAKMLLDKALDVQQVSLR